MGDKSGEFKKMNDFVKSKICSCDIIIDGTDQEKITQHVNMGHTLRKDNRTGKEYHDDVLRRIKKPVFTEFSKTHEFADYIQSKYTFKTFSDTYEILVHDGKVWIKNGSRIIAEEVQKLAPTWCSKRLVSEVEGVIQRRTFVDRSEFNQDFSKFVMENGILNLDTLELTDFDPNFLTTVKIPIVYDPTAKYPSLFVKSLGEWLQTPQNIITAVESMANILTANRKNFEVTIINLGRGSNGKTRFLNLIIGIFGQENGCDVSIHDMQYHKYALSDLDGKLFNIHDDISNKELNDMGNFKRSVSGSIMTAEQKNKPRFSIKPFAKHFYSTNEMPKITDDSDGTFRRIYPIKWDNQFLPGINRIEDIDKIILEKEKSGIFNILLQNYKSLLRQNGFRYKQSIESVRTLIKQESDKIQEFIDTCLIKQEGKYITKDDLFQKITEWYKFKGYVFDYSKVALGSKLPQYGLKGIDKKIDKKTTKVWTDYNWNFENDWVKSNIKKLEEKPKQEALLV
jgi:putative DNA primase/helicase